MVHDVDGGKRGRSPIVASVSEKKSEKSPEKPSQKKIEQWESKLEACAHTKLCLIVMRSWSHMQVHEFRTTLDDPMGTYTE